MPAPSNTIVDLQPAPGAAGALAGTCPNPGCGRTVSEARKRLLAHWSAWVGRCPHCGWLLFLDIEDLRPGARPPAWIADGEGGAALALRLPDRAEIEWNGLDVPAEQRDGAPPPPAPGGEG
jgi:hypothetical protein